MGKKRKVVEVSERDDRFVIEVMKTKQVPQLLTKQQAADALAVDVKTINRMIKNGELSTVKPTGDKGNVRIKASEIATLVDERTVAARPER